jgi:hypothetical protein
VQDIATPCFEGPVPQTAGWHAPRYEKTHHGQKKPCFVRLFDRKKISVGMANGPSAAAYFSAVRGWARAAALLRTRPARASGQSLMVPFEPARRRSCASAPPAPPPAPHRAAPPPRGSQVGSEHRYFWSILVVDLGQLAPCGKPQMLLMAPAWGTSALYDI